jgi:dTDP-4-dehydrorhamnose reductase
MKRILVTGAAGLLGANICYLLRKSYHVVALDTNRIEIDQITSIVGSALDVSLVEQTLVQEKIDILIHCAAITDMDRCEREFNYAYLVNQLLPKNLSYICNRYGAKLIFISSDSVYRGSDPGLHAEIDAVEPLSIYAKTKLGAEDAVLKNAKNLVVRTNMFGMNYRDKNSFGEWVIQALQNDETLNMFYDISFSPLLVNELVSVLDLCMERDLCGLYNVGSCEPISKYDLGMTIKEVFGLPGTINKTSMKDHTYLAPRTQNMGLDVSKIEQTLGIKLSTPRQGVEQFFALYQAGYRQKLKDGK